MAVVSTVWLPDQPGDGFTHVQPLGGNGKTAPISQVYCRATSAGDASGGTNQVELRFDEDHLTMVHWLGILLSGISSDSECLVDLRFGHAGVSMRHVQSLKLIHNAISGSGYAMFRPPPIVAPPRPGAGSGGATAPFIEVSVANAAGDDLTLDLMAYEYDANAAQITPFPYLVGAFAS